MFPEFDQATSIFKSKVDNEVISSRYVLKLGQNPFSVIFQHAVSLQSLLKKIIMFYGVTTLCWRSGFRFRERSWFGYKTLPTRRYKHSWQQEANSLYQRHHSPCKNCPLCYDFILKFVIKERYFILKMVHLEYQRQSFSVPARKLQPLPAKSCWDSRW